MCSTLTGRATTRPEVEWVLGPDPAPDEDDVQWQNSGAHLSNGLPQRLC